MSTTTSIGIYDDLATRQTRVAVRTANHEVTCRIDQQFRIFVLQEFMQKLAVSRVTFRYAGQEDINDILLDQFRCYAFIVLRREHDGIYTNGMILFVIFNGDLRLAIRTQIGHLLTFLADTGERIHQGVRQIQRQRHVVIRLVRRIAEHHSLITGALFLGISATHALIDIGGLSMKSRENTATLRFKFILGLGVADVRDGFTSNGLNVCPTFATHLAGNYHLTGSTQSLAGHMSLRVLR